MPILQITTFIKAPIQRVFDLSLSIDLHKISTANTNEEAIAGTTFGLIKLHETVTWQAIHLYKKRTMTIKIMALESPFYFKDEMQQGEFKLFRHEHYFKPIKDGTEMKDILAFESPFRLLGKLIDKVFMKKYLKRFLLQRNATIKEFAEGDGWEKVLNIETQRR